MTDLIKRRIAESIDIKTKIINDRELLANIEKAALAVIASYKKGGKIFFCGNGGSAADSQHLAAELVVQFNFKRGALPAEALSVNTSILTAVSNDYSFDHVFSRQIEAAGRKGDVLIGLSTSGRSINVRNALAQAREMGIFTIAFTGEEPNILADVSDLCLKAPSKETPRIQEVHILLGHILCEIAEAAIFKNVE